MTGCRLRSETVILSVSYRVVCVWNRLQSEGEKDRQENEKKIKDHAFIRSDPHGRCTSSVQLCAYLKSQFSSCIGL